MLDRVICKLEVDPLDGRSLKVTALNPYQPNPLNLTEDDYNNDKDGEVYQPCFQDNSVYEFNIPNLKAKNGSPSNIHVKYITSPSPCFINLRDVTSLANGLQLDDESVMYHIREATRYANFLIDKYNESNPAEPIAVNKYNIKTQHFEIYMFIKYKALRDCLLDFYIKKASEPNNIKNTTGDLSYEHDFDLSAIKELLDDIQKQYEEWEKEIVTRTAVPKAALRGKYSYTKVYPTHLSSSGYGRDKYPTGFDVYSNPYRRR